MGLSGQPRADGQESKLFTLGYLNLSLLTFGPKAALESEGGDSCSAWSAPSLGFGRLVGFWFILSPSEDTELSVTPSEEVSGLFSCDQEKQGPLGLWGTVLDVWGYQIIILDCTYPQTISCDICLSLYNFDMPLNYLESCPNGVSDSVIKLGPEILYFQQAPRW